MIPARKLLSILALTALVSACDNDNDFVPAPAPGTPPPPTAAEFQIVHAVADAPTVDVSNSVATFVTGAAFKDVTGFLTVVEGTLTVQADANIPGGQVTVIPDRRAAIVLNHSATHLMPGGQVTVIPATDLAISADTQTTLIAAGEAGNGSIAPIVVTNPVSPIDMGYVRVEVVHAAPNAGDVDLALSVKEMRLAENLVGTGPVPPLDGGVDMVLEDGVAWFAGGEWSLRGESGTIRNAHIEPGTDASIVASGTFSVDEDGLLDAEVTIEVTNPDRIGKLLADVLPEYEGQIKSTASGLAALGDKAQLPLRVVKGKVSFGPFNLGELAPLP